MTPYSIHLFFDTRTESAIYSVWQELAESGAAPYFYQSANRPHLTLSIYNTLDLPQARQRLSELATRLTAVPVSFQYHGFFSGDAPTIFLGPLVTTTLLELQEDVCWQLDDLGELPAFDHYRPGHWVPHCSLAFRYDGARFLEAMYIAQRLILPLEGEICEIGLTEMDPVKQLEHWRLLNDL